MACHVALLLKASVLVTVSVGPVQFCHRMLLGGLEGTCLLRPRVVWSRFRGGLTGGFLGGFFAGFEEVAEEHQQGEEAGDGGDEQDDPG